MGKLTFSECKYEVILYLSFVVDIYSLGSWSQVSLAFLTSVVPKIETVQTRDSILLGLWHWVSFLHLMLILLFMDMELSLSS
jgi:hypothetical protein